MHPKKQKKTKNENKNKRKGNKRDNVVKKVLYCSLTRNGKYKVKNKIKIEQRRMIFNLNVRYPKMHESAKKNVKKRKIRRKTVNNTSDIFFFWKNSLTHNFAGKIQGFQSGKMNKKKKFVPLFRGFPGGKHTHREEKNLTFIFLILKTWLY